jgi:hypothetical protein
LSLLGNTLSYAEFNWDGSLAGGCTNCGGSGSTIAGAGFGQDEVSTGSYKFWLTDPEDYCAGRPNDPKCAIAPPTTGAQTEAATSGAAQGQKYTETRTQTQTSLGIIIVQGTVVTQYVTTYGSIIMTYPTQSVSTGTQTVTSRSTATTSYTWTGTATSGQTTTSKEGAQSTGGVTNTGASTSTIIVRSDGRTEIDTTTGAGTSKETSTRTVITDQGSGDFVPGHGYQLTGMALLPLGSSIPFTWIRLELTSDSVYLVNPIAMLMLFAIVVALAYALLSKKLKLS